MRETLVVLDSLPVIIFILAVVVCAVTLPTQSGADLCGDWVLKDGLEYGFVVFFLIEVIIRLTCTGWRGYFTGEYDPSEAFDPAFDPYDNKLLFPNFCPQIQSV
jgi:hypothetical protein